MTFRSWRNTISPSEQAIVAACLRAAADGPFFPDFPYTALFGFTRREMRAFAAQWPASEDEQLESAAVNGALSHLRNHPISEPDAWTDWIPVSMDEMESLHSRIRQASGAARAARAFLDRQMHDLAALSDEAFRVRRSEAATVRAAAEHHGLAVPAQLVDRLSPGHSA